MKCANFLKEHMCDSVVVHVSSTTVTYTHVETAGAWGQGQHSPPHPPTKVKPPGIYSLKKTLLWYISDLIYTFFAKIYLKQTF